MSVSFSLFLFRKQLLSKEEDIKRRLSSHAIPHLPHSSTLSPLSHPPHDTSHFSHKSLQTPPTNTPSPSTNLSTQQSITSDQQWDVNNEIIDSLSESEDYLLSFACDDELLHKEREEGGGGIEMTSGLEQTSHIMSSVTSQLATQTAGIRREGETRNHVTKLTSAQLPTPDSVLNPSPCTSQGAPEVIEIVPSPPMGASTTVGTLSKPTKFAPFKPPFSATSHQCCDSVQPSQSSMPDNGAEFQGNYPHTQEMMKIFTQVCLPQGAISSVNENPGATDRGEMGRDSEPQGSLKVMKIVLIHCSFF